MLCIIITSSNFVICCIVVCDTHIVLLFKCVLYFGGRLFGFCVGGGSSMCGTQVTQMSDGAVFGNVRNSTLY